MLKSYKLAQKRRDIFNCEIAGNRAFSNGHARFRLSPVLTRALTFDPLHVSLSLTSVTISWTSLTIDVISAISTMQIKYRKSENADDVSSHDLNPRESYVNLVGLASGTAYVSKFEVLLVNGSVITTLPLHFVTVAEGSYPFRTANSLGHDVYSSSLFYVGDQLLYVEAYVHTRATRGGKRSE